MTWQPIETAPRDGTRVLVCEWEEERPIQWVAEWCEPRDCVWLHRAGFVPYFNRSDTPILRPTHWQPLPAPPEPGKEATRGEV